MTTWDLVGGTTLTATEATMVMNESFAGTLRSVAGYNLVGHSQSVAVVMDESYWGVNPTAANPAHPGPYAYFDWACQTAFVTQYAYFARDTVGVNPNVLEIGLGDTGPAAFFLRFTWDPVNHKYWRLKEAASTLSWDVSPDGVTWTTLHSIGSTGLILTNGAFEFQAASRTVTSGDPPHFAVWSHLRGLINDWPSGMLDEFPGAALGEVWVDQAATATVSGGQLHMPVTTTGGRIVTVAPYDMTDGYVIVHIVGWGELPGVSNSFGRLPCIWISSIAFGDTFTSDPWPWDACKAQFQASWPAGSLALTPVYSQDDGSVPGALNAVQTSLTGATEIVDFVTHAYLRISHSTATGLISWERSADGVAWTTMATIAKPADWQLNRVMVELSEHTPGF